MKHTYSFSQLYLTIFAFFCLNIGCEKKYTPVNTIPLPPSNLNGKVISPTQIDLSWTDNSTNESGFKIERRSDTGTYKVIGTTNLNVISFSDLGLQPGSVYFYRVYSFNSTGSSVTYSNEISMLTSGIPLIKTLNVDFTTNSAYSGGSITSDGGYSILSKGVVWSMSPLPTISLITKTNEGVGSSTFSSTILGLIPNTKYYLRAYATNSYGTSYGDEITFNTVSNIVSDIDGNSYSVITIGKQIWMGENLKTSKYQNGDLIPEIQSANSWISLKTGALVYYDNNSNNNTQYGKLYNWFVANDPRKACPVNWRVPTSADWTILSNNYGGIELAGAKLKSIGTSLWAAPNIADNQSGFSATPNGCRCNQGGAFGGGPQPPNQGNAAVFWTSSEVSTNSEFAILRQIYNNSPRLDSGSNYKYYGFGIRCIRN